MLDIIFSAYTWAFNGIAFGHNIIKNLSNLFILLGSFAGGILLASSNHSNYFSVTKCAYICYNILYKKYQNFYCTLSKGNLLHDFHDFNTF